VHGSDHDHDDRDDKSAGENRVSLANFARERLAQCIESNLIPGLYLRNKYARISLADSVVEYLQNLVGQPVSLAMEMANWMGPGKRLCQCYSFGLDCGSFYEATDPCLLLGSVAFAYVSSAVAKWVGPVNIPCRCSSSDAGSSPCLFLVSVALAHERIYTPCSPYHHCVVPKLLLRLLHRPTIRAASLKNRSGAVDDSSIYGRRLLVSVYPGSHQHRFHHQQEEERGDFPFPQLSLLISIWRWVRAHWIQTSVWVMVYAFYFQFFPWNSVVPYCCGVESQWHGVRDQV